MARISDSLDGFHVDEFTLTFRGADPVTPSEASLLAYDDEVLVVVRARVKAPRWKESRHGEITRVNVLQLQETALVRSPDLRKPLCDTLGMDLPTALTFEDHIPSGDTPIEDSEPETYSLPEPVIPEAEKYEEPISEDEPPFIPQSDVIQRVGGPRVVRDEVLERFLAGGNV